MSQRGSFPPLRVMVPPVGNSPSQRLSKYHIAFSPSPTPVPVIYQRPHSGGLWIAVLLQLSSLYAAHQWLQRSQQVHQPSEIQFAYFTFFGASVILGFLQRPWKGRSVSSSQWSLLFISGALLALSFLFRMRGLAHVGPLETILAEYAGAVVGKVLIKAQRKVHGIGNAKLRGAIAFSVGLFLLSQGWCTAACSPVSSLFLPAVRTRKLSSAKLTRSTRIGNISESRTFLSGEEVWPLDREDCTKYVYLLAPVVAGLLSSIQKLFPSNTNLSSLPKKRLQALTYLTAGAVYIPVALFQLAFPMGRSAGGLDQQVVWPLFSMIAFGTVVAFYGEFYSEEKLLVSPLSPFHFFVTVCSVCLLELTYGSNFSLLGFVVCSAILAVGVRAGAFISGGLDWNSISEKEYDTASLFSMLKSPIHHIWTDVKTRKIAMFLLLNTSFMVVEFLYGFLSNSLGLISDACHMLFDCAALAIGLYASYISRLPPNLKFNFGYGRFEVLSGYANAVFLVLVASLIVLESLERLLEPPEISTESLLVVSVGGLVVNVVGLIFFHEAHHHAHGSAPCTHVHHAHSDRSGPLASSKDGHRHSPHDQRQVLHDCLMIHADHSLVAVEMVEREEESCDNDGQICHSASERKISFDHCLNQSENQFDGHSGDCSFHHKHDHRNSSPLGHSSPLHLRSHEEHELSAGCSRNHEGQHNVFAQQDHVHKPCSSCSHRHEHFKGHTCCFDQPLQQNSHSYSEDKQVGTQSAPHRDAGLDMSDTDTLSRSCTEQQQKNTCVSGGGANGRREDDNHLYLEGARSISDYEAGLSHHHSGQSRSRDQDNLSILDDREYRGDDHGHSHSCNGNHHHDKEMHFHTHGFDQDHEEHSDHHHIDHNMEGIFLHILADTLGSVGVVISTLLIKYKGWLFTDPACSIFISVLIVSSVLPLVRNSAELLLQRVPRSAEKRIQKALRKVEDVEGVHDWHKLHVWSNTNTELVGTLRLHASVGTNKLFVHKKVSRILEDAGIMDLTLEVEDLEQEDDQ